jgi:choice-of-anchor A domain-containing protein
MYHSKVRIVGAVILIALFMSLSGIFATTAYADSEPRTVTTPPLGTNADSVANNPNQTLNFECSGVQGELDQYGALYPFTAWPYGTLNQFKFDGEPLTSSQTYTDIDNAPVANPSITLQGTGNSLTWSSNFGIDLVLMKGGTDGTNIYIYSPSGTSGSGLTVPTGQGISHVTFCWDNPATIKVDKTTNPDSLDDTPFNFTLNIPSYLKGETSTTESFTLSDNGGIKTFLDLPKGDYDLSEVLTPVEDSQNSTSVVCTLERNSSTTTIVNSSEDESIDLDSLLGKDVVTCNFTNEQLSEPEVCVEDVTSSVSWMNEFNLITLEDLAGVTHVQGFTFIGGDYTDTSLSEFNQSSPYATCSQASVTIFGSILSGTQLRAEHGDVVVGGAKNGTVLFNGGAGCSVVFDKPLSKDAITVAFQNASLKLSQATANNTAAVENGNQLNFNVTNVDANGLAVFNIAANDSFNLGSIAQIEVKGNHSAANTILINVSGSTVNWNNGNMVGMLTSNAGRQKVIWNFYEATTINTNKNFNGALLAPFADVNTSSVNLDGSVVVKKLSNAGEVHRPDLSLSNTEPLTSVCSPATNPAIVIKKYTNGEDADTATGPVVEVGSTVEWTYIVTNTGDVMLTNVSITDDQGVTVSCPDTELSAGETMTCTASGTAVSGQYKNVGTVTGTPPKGEPVSDDDPSHYFGSQPGITIKKYTNDEDADAATGPIVEVGSTVNWTYIVTNTGNVTLTGVTVTDDQSVTVSCPETELSVGETMTCAANGIAVAGQYKNIGTVTGNPPVSTPVSDNDPSHYFGADPAIVIKKYTNGEDADTETGPIVEVGSTVNWTYVITNTGNVALTNVTLSDDQGVSVSCPKTELAAGETMTCTASGTAVAGQYKNIGTVTGNPPVGTPVSDDDPSHYFGTDPAIVIKKYTNGEDADTETGPIVEVGSIVNWTYIVTNTGNVTLTNVSVSDDQGVSVNCPNTELSVGESMTCAASGTAVAGQYKNVGTVTGNPPVGTPVSDDDPSHYFGSIPQPAPASLGDRVWHDLNANGVQDGGEPGISNVTVTLFNGNGAQVGASTTNVDGIYAFTNLTPGSYYVVFSLNTLLSGYVVTAQNVGDDLFDSDGAAGTGQTQNVTLAAGENNLSLDLGIYQPASLGDRVWVDSNENGQQDVGEANVPGVTVTLFNSNNVQVGQPTTTDGNGLYAFTNLVPGSYYVVFSLPANSSFTTANQGGVSEGLDSDADATGKTPVVILTSGQNYLDLDAGIVLEPEIEVVLSTLGNKVWFDRNKNGIQDENEAGVAGVKVDLYTGDGSFVATDTTDANGEYLFTGLNAGTYYVEFANVEGYSFTHYNVTGNSQDAADNDPVVPVVEVSVSDGGVEGQFGQPLAYTFLYTNTDATLAASNVVISTTVPVGTSFTPDGSGWICAAGTVCTFTIPTVAANSSSSVTFVVTLGFTDAEVPDALELLVSLTQSTVARTEVVTLGEGETNLTVDAGLVRIEASLQTATPTAPTNLPGTGQPQARRAMFLPTVQSRD